MQPKCTAVRVNAFRKLSIIITILSSSCIRFYLYIRNRSRLISCYSSYRVYGMHITCTYTHAQHMCLCIGNENRLFCGREPVSPAEEFLHSSDLTCERSARNTTFDRSEHCISIIIYYYTDFKNCILCGVHTTHTRPLAQAQTGFFLKREFINSYIIKQRLPSTLFARSQSAAVCEK